MAKPKGVPALTAERVWQAIRDGSLQVEVVEGTRLLRVIEGRLRLTWKSGKSHQSRRVRVARGVYLNPRWLPVGSLAEIEVYLSWSQAERLSRGILQTPEGRWYRLIYQWVEDVFHQDRQLDQHIFPQYKKEEEELWQLLDQMAVSAGGDLPVLVDQRLGRIGTIRTRLADRAQAARQRADSILRRCRHVRGACEKILEQPFSTQGARLGISQALRRHAQDLETIRNKERWFNLGQFLYWVVFHLQKAAEAVERGKEDLARRSLLKALEYLEKFIKQVEASDDLPRSS